MKIFTAAFTFVFVFLLAASVQAKMQHDPRRTLFVPTGQTTLMLEAPLGMCFADPSRKSEGALYDFFNDYLRTEGDSMLLGVFANCTSLVNAGNPENPEGDVVTAGIVTWANPAIGETLDIALADYIDLRAESFREYAQLRLSSWVDFTTNNGEEGSEVNGVLLDEAVTRSKDGVSIGFSEDLRIRYRDYTTIAILGTTSLKTRPIEVLLRLNNKDDLYDMKQAHDLMHKFLAQQVALNR